MGDNNYNFMVVKYQDVFFNEKVAVDLGRI